jgi:AAA domain
MTTWRKNNLAAPQRLADAGPVREIAYARRSLLICAEEVETATTETRTNVLNTAAVRMGRVIAAGWIKPSLVRERLFQAAKQCGLVADAGEQSVLETLDSGLLSGREQPHPPLVKSRRRSEDPLSGGINVRWAGSKDWPTANWLVDDLIPEDCVGLFVGESQAGKSFTCISLAGSLAVGKPFFGKEISAPRGTIYVCAEGLFSIGPRLEAEIRGSIQPYLAQKDKEGAGGDNIASRLPIAELDDVPDLVQDDAVEWLIGTMLAVAEDMRNRLGVPLGLVIIDTMISAIGIENLNDAISARQAVDVLKKIQRATGAVVLGVHHHGKKKSSGPTGSFAFTALPDFIVSVHRAVDENEQVRRRWVTTTKSRNGETGWCCGFDLTDVLIDVSENGRKKHCAFVDPLPEGSSDEASNTNPR